jgi:SAM-dependent methyltransferase
VNIDDLRPLFSTIKTSFNNNNIDPLTGMLVAEIDPKTSKVSDLSLLHKPDDSISYPDDPNKRFVMNSRTLGQYAIPEKYKDPNQICGPILDLAAGKKAKFIVELNELAKAQNINLITHAVDLAMDPQLINANPKIYSNADMHKLPYDDSSIGTIVSSFGPLIFGDYPSGNKDILLQEMYRILKPNGEAVITPISDLGKKDKQKKLEDLALKNGFTVSYEQVSNCQDPTFIAMGTQPTAMILKK